MHDDWKMPSVQEIRFARKTAANSAQQMMVYWGPFWHGRVLGRSIDAQPTTEGSGCEILPRLCDDLASHPLKL
jgi:hypothetical protein